MRVEGVEFPDGFSENFKDFFLSNSLGIKSLLIFATAYVSKDFFDSFDFFFHSFLGNIFR